MQQTNEHQSEPDTGSFDFPNESTPKGEFESRLTYPKEFESDINPETNKDRIEDKVFDAVFDIVDILRF
jgi:hypothetical protein